MTISSDRTIVLGRQPRGRPLQWLHRAHPGDNLDYSLDLTASLLDIGGDTIASVSLSAQPSGTGELQAANLSVAGNVITAWLSGGIYGRRYVVRVIAMGLSGHQFEWDVGLEMSTRLAAWPPPVEPSPGFGPAITWSMPTSFDFSQSTNSMLLGF